MKENRQTPPMLDNVKYPTKHSSDKSAMFKAEKKKHRKRFFIGAGIAVIFFVVLYIVQGPAHGDKHVARIRETLIKDSIALNSKDVYPKPGIYDPWDVRNEVDKIYGYGDPTRFDRYDSLFVMTDPRIAPLAQYNVSKCKEVLKEVLPQWRRIFANSISAKSDNEGNLIARAEGDDAETLGIYSLKYLDPKAAKEDYLYYAGAMNKLGFKELAFGIYPGEVILTYTFSSEEKKSNK